MVFVVAVTILSFMFWILFTCIHYFYCKATCNFVFERCSINKVIIVHGKNLKRRGEGEVVLGQEKK